MCSLQNHKSIVLTNGIKRKIRHYYRKGINRGENYYYEGVIVLYLKKYNPTLWRM